MKGGFFGAPSRGSRGRGEKIPGTSFNSGLYVFLSLMIISIVMLLVSGSNAVANVKNFGLSAFFGVRNGIHELSSAVSRTILSIRELADLRREHAELLMQMERFEELERSNAEIYQENMRLREQLEFSATLRYRHIPAQITGRDPDNLYSAIVINKGSLAGAANNMAVVALQNGIQALVGKVIQTSAFESLVMPIYDVNSQVSSRLSVSRFEGIIEGQGNPDSTLIMRFVPRRARDEINIGDIVISSGMGGIFPAGVIIGRVSAVHVPDYATSLIIEITPSIDFTRLEYVFVIEAETALSGQEGADD